MSIEDILSEIKKMGYNVSKVRNTVIVNTTPDRLLSLAKKLVDYGYDHLANVEGVDYPSKNIIEVIYHAETYSTELRNFLIEVKVSVPRSNPTIPSVLEVWPNGLFMERETWEMLGVVFKGNPDLRHLLLPPDWKDIPPLRKDFKIEAEGPSVYWILRRSVKGSEEKNE